MGTLLPCTWALADSAPKGGMTVWTTVVAAQSQQQDQATLERGQTMAVPTHNAVAVGEAAGQLLDVKLGRLRPGASAGCSRRKGQAPATWNKGDRVAAEHDRTRRLHVHSAVREPHSRESAAADQHLNRERICTLPDLLIGHSTVPLDSQNIAQAPMYKNIHPLQVGLLKCQGLNPMQQGR